MAPERSSKRLKHSSNPRYTAQVVYKIDDGSHVAGVGTRELVFEYNFLSRTHSFTLLESGAGLVDGNLRNLRMKQERLKLVGTRQGWVDLLVESLEVGPAAKETAVAYLKTQFPDFKLRGDYLGHLNTGSFSLTHDDTCIVLQLPDMPESIGLHAIDPKRCSFSNSVVERALSQCAEKYEQRWLNALKKAEDNTQQLRLQAVLICATEADADAVRGAGQTRPSTSVRLANIKELLSSFVVQTSTYSVKQLLREIREVQTFMVEVAVSPSPLNNPGGLYHYTSHALSLPAWAADGGPEAEFGEACAAWRLALEDLCATANSQPGGMQIDDFNRQVVELRPAPRLPRQGAEPGRGGKMSRLEYILHRRLQSAVTDGSAVGGRPFFSATSDEFKSIESAFMERVLKQTGNEQFLCSDYSGLELGRASATKVPMMDLLNSDSGSGISIDHVDQVTVTRSSDGQVETSFSTIENLYLSSDTENFEKHRYCVPAFALGNAVLFKVDGLPALWADNPAVPDLIELVDIIILVTDCWPEPCWHEERRLLPADLVIAARKFEVDVLAALGLDCYEPLAELVLERDDVDVVEHSELVRREVSDREAQLKGERYADLLRVGLARVRNPDREGGQAGAGVVKELMAVGKQLAREGEEAWGIRIKKNKDGIPAMTLDGRESAAELGYALLQTKLALKGRGYDIPERALYALTIMYNLNNARLDPVEHTDLDAIILTSYTMPGVPFIIPYQNKGMYSPSTSRSDHTVAGYLTGFKSDAIKDLTLTGWDSRKATFGLDPWAVNSAVRGDAEGVKETAARAFESARAWMERAGRFKWATAEGSDDAKKAKWAEVKEKVRLLAKELEAV